jgi:7-cyano-7-deazaguanine synthase
MIPADHPSAAVAVLVSGGLDSAILLAEMSRQRETVHPLYVRFGLSWEAEELRHLRRFLEAVQRPALQPLRVLEMPVQDLYDDHWSVTGWDVPDANSPDAAVFLPGRNVLLLAKAMLWCRLHAVPAVALAPLDSNPFPDATADFFGAYERVVNGAINGAVRVLRPFASLCKVEVMRRGRDLPLKLTFSCIRPIVGKHCGACNKCAERRKAFADSKIVDETEYAKAI